MLSVFPYALAIPLDSLMMCLSSLKIVFFFSVSSSFKRSLCVSTTVFFSYVFFNCFPSVLLVFSIVLAVSFSKKFILMKPSLPVLPFVYCAFGIVSKSLPNKQVHLKQL